MRAFAALLLILVLAAAGLVVFTVFSGRYDIAASRLQSAPLRWILQTTVRNSVRTHALGIKTPPLYRQSKNEGFRNYDRACVICHGAPGTSRSGIGEGLQPTPPDLSRHVGDWSPAELFWIIKHGLAFTGMPGFGMNRSNEKIWSIVAFLEELPEISPWEYHQLRERLGSGNQEPQARPLEQGQDVFLKQAI